MLKIYASSMLLCIAATIPAVHADELGDAAQALCEKVKSCALAELEGQKRIP